MQARRRQKKQRQHKGLDLLEEAFHTLRTSSLSTLATYYLGCVPFVVVLFYFWADMSRSSFALQDAAFASLLMGLAYFWMKGWQAVFCRKIWVQLNSGGKAIERSHAMTFRYQAAQLFIHSTAIPLLAIAVICMIPLAWVYAFYQNVSALGLTQDYGKKPLRHLLSDAAQQSHWAWGNNHMLLAALAVFTLFVWMSVLMVAVGLPVLAKSLLGIESVFTLNPIATLMNSTFILGTFLVVFLCVSPLAKTLYVIRCFYGVSRSTGADIISRLSGLRAMEADENSRSSQHRNSVAMILVTLSLFAFPLSGLSQEQISSPEGAATSQIISPSAGDFDAAVRDTLQEKHFQWRLPREQMIGEEEGGAKGFIHDLMQSMVSVIKEGFELLETYLKKMFEGNQEGNEARGFGDWGDIGKLASVLTVVLLTILLVMVVRIIIIRSRKSGVVQVEGEVVGPIDLESDTVIATQLPEDEWMRLAREKIEQGEYRLAMRALFLASLAHLGEHGLLKVARFKSNKDYRGELSLKARSLPVVVEAFNDNVGLFEWVWYGLHEIGNDAIERFTSNYEKITSLTAQSGKEEHAV